ncbi:MAG: hypothetical protein AABZ60_13350 [Planctomycetota bacterium]
MSWTFNNVSIPPAGNISLTTPYGIVTITDIADQKIAGHPAQTWGLLINYKTQAWVFGYEGGGRISLEIDSRGNLLVTGNGTVLELAYRLP